MSQAEQSGPPRRLLLATDLSARSDRAMDRAAALAEEWGATLLALHVMDPAEPALEQRLRSDLPSWRRAPGQAQLAEARVRKDLQRALADVRVVVETGDPATVIQTVAEREACELIVTGIARDETLGRYILGATVERLIRRTALPTLVVKSRERPCLEVLVATDFSETSRHALEAAARFFPQARLTLLHAYEVPFALFIDDDRATRQFDSAAQATADAFLASAALDDRRRREATVLIERGRPEVLVADYMHQYGVDIVVVGTHGRSAAWDVLLGSTSKRILESAPGDVLLIRDPRSVPAAEQR